ncbi:MAG TPA: class I SAM-dependent methyltransferase [Pyrinomonadaceae bacterium]|nr:class I SAM-dependent methyltransferase [Pyrinomonadaceae bacterium]
MSIPSNWFEDFFHGVTLDLWRKAIPRKQTISEADFLGQVLQCDAGSHLLDVPCGNGRISIELAKRGFRVTGVDIAQEFIAEAREAATAANGDTKAGAEFILGDMRSLDGAAIFDGAFCFGNSFGFMKYSDMEKFLAGVATALKPGARFIVETNMAAESLLPDFEEQTSHEVGDISVTIKERYIAEESCVDSEYIFERNGTSETRKAKHWIYTTAEIRRMLERAGFEVLEMFSSLKREPYKLGSNDLIVITQKRAETRP